MDIKKKLNMDYDGLVKYGPINIVAFGDSITHGALSTNEFNYETVYWNLLKRKILSVRDYIPVNMINAGIGGTTAKSSLSRIKDQVLSHNPDLVIVCFGLNDINGSLEDYTNSLKTIFEECKRKGADVIFMTPNTLNSYVAKDTDESLRHYASVTAEMQNNGKMDKYIQSAVELAFKSGIKVCDCYSAWKKLSKTQDTTMLLANRINHPKSEMHELFAEMLFETIFDDDAFYTKPADSAMFHE